MVEKKIDKGNSFKKKIASNIGCSFAGLVLIGMLGGGAFVGYQGRVNYANAIGIERGILEEEGLLGEHSLISWNTVSGSASSSIKDYLINSEVESGGKKIKVAKIKLEVRGRDGTIQYVKFSVPKENIKLIVAKDPNAKPTILFNPENFVKQDDIKIFPIEKIVPRYTIINSNDPKVLTPIGGVTIFLSQKDYNDFNNAR